MTRIKEFEVLNENHLNTIFGGTGELEAVGIITGIAWGIYSFGEAAGKSVYYLTHPK
ncbi:bacteriocin [Streptococcus hongkongensis]